MVGGGDHFYLKFWITPPPWSEIAEFERIIARSASAVTPSEKQLTLIGSPITRFPIIIIIIIIIIISERHDNVIV